MARDDIAGNWYGMMVSTPHWGPMVVSFEGHDGFYTGKWEFPSLDKGQARRGKFTAVRFANWLHVRITTSPLAGTQFQLTFVGSKGKSMVFGAIPLDDADFPFATVTLFRIALGKDQMTGLCPILPRRTKA